MLKRSFFALSTPRLQVEAVHTRLPAPTQIAAPESIKLLIEDQPDNGQTMLIQPGDSVKAGQKIQLSAQSEAYAITTSAGTIANIERFPGESGKQYTAVTITASQNPAKDDSFSTYCSNPSLQGAIDLLQCLPGSPDFTIFQADTDNPIQTIVINAMDQDLLIITAQYALNTFLAELKTGIQHLKAITGIESVVLAAPKEIVQGYGEIGANVISIDTGYPQGLPHLVAQRVTGSEIPAQTELKKLGLAFLDIEAVVTLGRSLETQEMAQTKLVTFIDKQGNRSLVSATIGTPIGNIFTHLGLTLNDQDRIIIGGPLNGFSTFSDAFPVRPDTHAIMVQDKDDIAMVSDTACINCGDCVRICPARIPVNLLIRYLEAGEYEEAADNYDLYACIDCGLCSFVCVAKIPIYQSIKLAKYELEQATDGEAEDE